MKQKFKYLLVAILSSVITVLSIFLILKFSLGLNNNDIKNMLNLNIAYYMISKYHIKSDTENTATISGIEAMLKSLDDPHSSYLNKDLYKKLMEQTKGDFIGIGVMIGKNKDNKTAIMKVMPNSPSEKAGLQEKDIFLKIDDKNVENADTEEIANLVRGQINTDVKIEVLRNNQKLDFVVTREKIDYPTIYEKMIDEKHEIGYIGIAMFSENTHRDFVNALDTLKQEGAKGIIIDLRNNPGGLLQSVVPIGKEVLPLGNIVSVINKNNQRQTFEVTEAKKLLPMVVLINQNSASASEILAASMQERKVATIVGEKSYGKGTVQIVMPLLKEDGMKITIAKYYTPNLKSLDGVGVVPDVEIKNIDKNIDNQLEKGKEILINKMKSN